MQVPARQVHALRAGRYVQTSQHGGQTRRMDGLNTRNGSLLEKSVQSFVPECFYHVLLYRVTYQLSSNIMCRSEEHTSELQSLMRISYAVFCLKKKKTTTTQHEHHTTTHI